MKLINLDKVRWKEGFYDMHTGEQFAPMIFNTEEWLEWATKDAEVRAIPIEWIENKLKCCDNINAEIFVKALIRDWEKENDFATNSRLGNRSNGDNDSNISSTTNSGLYKESITR